MKGFSANVFCRFCLTNIEDINFIFDESLCEMRSNETYSKHLIMGEPSSTGVSDISILTEMYTL